MLKRISGFEIEVRYKKIKNLYLRVSRDNVVSVSAPIGYPDEKLTAFVESRRKWLEKAVARMQTKAMPVLFDGATVSVLGNNYTVIRNNPSSPREKSVRIDGSTIIVTASPTDFVLQAERFLAKALKSNAVYWLNYYAERSGMSYGEVEVKKMRSRWGYCRIKDKKIVFSLNLVYKPAVCLEYVALHELAHTQVAAHDKRFYSIIAKYMPSYKSAIKLLKQ